MTNKKRLFISICVSFLGLYLPLFVLGSAWPAMRADLALPLEYIGVLNSVQLLSTMCACLLNGRIMKRFFSGNVICLTYLFLAITLCSISFVKTGLMLTVLLVPLGLFIGTTDSGSNLFVSLNYSVRNMNFLHVLGSVGTMAGPLIIMFCMTRFNWQSAWVVMAVIGAVCFGLLFWCRILGYWVDIRHQDEKPEADVRKESVSKNSLPTIVATLAFFFVFAGSGNISGNLMSSYLRDYLGTTLEAASMSVTVFLGMMAVGRFCSGLLSARFTTLTIVRTGLALGAIGCVIGTAIPTEAGAFLGVIFSGFGSGPVYPCMLHETSRRFSPSLHKHMVGYQIGIAQIGGAAATFVTSHIFANTSLGFIFPTIGILYIVCLIINEYAVKQYPKTSDPK